MVATLRHPALQENLMRYSSLLAAVIVSCPAVPFTAAAAGNLNMICSADVVVCEQMTTLFSQSHPDIRLSMVRLSAGEAYALSAAKREIPAPISGGPAPATRTCRPQKRG